MRCLLMLLLAMISLPVLGNDSRHMVSFGRNGLGWSGAYEKMGTRSSSPFDEAKYFLGDLGLNYAYRISRRWQIGGFYQSSHDEYRFSKSGGNSFAKIDTSVYGLFGLYNFSNAIKESYYVGSSISYFSIADEVSHNWDETEGKAPFELDDRGFTIELIVGKRFTLKSWGIENLTFSPQFSLYHREHGRDFKDQRIRPGLGLGLQLIKFDLLF